MNFWEFLYRVLVYPLEFLFELVFSNAQNCFHNAIISIVILSLVVNTLALPLYNRAEIIQNEERETEKKLEKWTKHIKSTFKGDERFMMLQYYYNMSGYKQYYVLRSSIPLLLQVPFFMAAYNFLSNLAQLDGVNLGPIANLSQPDGIINIGSFSINVLPILMTLINVIASTIYAKGLSRSTKIQMYGVALVFLVLLYNSPAGLVFYWLLNNFYSLGKNIVYRYVPIKKVEKTNSISKLDNRVFILGALTTAIFTGFTIPSETVGRGPTDFVILSHYTSPVSLVWYAFTMAIGIFVVWASVYYLLLNDSCKKLMGLFFTEIAVVFLYNAFIYQRVDTSISDAFANISCYTYSSKEIISNTVIVLLIIGFVFLVWKTSRRIIPLVMSIILFASVAYGIFCYNQILKEMGGEYYLSNNYSTKVELNLSRNGRNVVVLMLDRAIGSYYPYIMNNDNNLYEEFEGFTYYSNAVSYSCNTLFAAPAIYGGPDYTVASINRRYDESLADKTNEALLTLPVLMQNNGYNVTVTNPPFAGYHWIEDLSIYDEYGIDAYVTRGAYGDALPNYSENVDAYIVRQKRNLFCYSISRSVPVLLTDFIHDGGNYGAVEYADVSISESDRFNVRFEEAYSSLLSLSASTTISDDESDNFLLLTNGATHEPVRLWDTDYPDGIINWSGDTLQFDDEAQVWSYQTNVASLEAVGEWLRYLKDEGVYDNTRIIIVSDHGFGLSLHDDWYSSGVDLTAINCALLVKDFNSRENVINEEYISNASVPYLVTNGLISNPTNPFTGTLFTEDYLNQDQYVFVSQMVNPRQNGGNQFINGEWYILNGSSYGEFTLTPTNPPQ